MVRNSKKVTLEERAVLSPVRTRRSFSQRAKEIKDCLQTDSSDNDVKSPPRKMRSVKVEKAEFRESNRPRTRSLTLEVEVDRVPARCSKSNESPRSNVPRSVPARGKGGRKKKQSLERTPDQGTVVRRSVRESRKVFDSLNEHNLVHTLVGDYSQSRRPSERRALLDDTETDSQGEPSTYVSMYDIIKNKTKTDEEDEEQEEEDIEQNEEENSSEEDDDEEIEEDDDIPQQRYTLRKNKPITKRYTAPPLKTCSSSHMRVRGSKEPFSPVRKSYKLKRKTINDSSTSSDEDDDNRRFERRKSKSMTKARNRCLPMNLGLEDVTKGILADRERVGSSLADVDPMNVDRSITFDSIGGLKKHIRSLKEMVVFPLLYPEVFEKFKVNPPRGVLFSGPPGTGKTLMARALANECSQDSKKVAFFMRKGADCLSKWVGESERQLRLLFDQAFKMRPSILFFDEIDGLAPVRSSRQDQIHSSIVSTLLALMDGLDNRGEIVVIGATNRIDSIDPALRRPGRFDREFIFPLPDKNARRNILSIHTKAWQPKLTQMFINEVADRCVGYCGADLKALCTEATLYALRRRYPQIYASKKKLILDINSVQVNGRDFAKAITTIVPACQRAVNTPGRALDSQIRPLLHDILTKALTAVKNVFPPSIRKTVDEASPGGATINAVMSDSESSDEDDDATEIYECDARTRAARAARREELRGSRIGNDNAWHCFTDNTMTSKGVYRPRFLVCGRPGMGQSTHITPALLHSMEHLPVHCLDLPALFGCASKTPEEACAQIFREARRVAPSIIYLSRIELLWSTTTDTLKATFLSLLNDLPPTTPLLIFATSDLPLAELSSELSTIFSTTAESVYEVPEPSANDRQSYYETLLMNEALKMPCGYTKQRAKKPLEVLPVAPPPVPRELNASELQKVREDEENTLRELRIFLREITVKLMSDRKFKEFYKPVDLDEVPDYCEVIKIPMDLSTMLQKVDGHHYQTCADYLCDIDLITSNALEYNPNADTFDRLIRHRACALKDCAHSLIMSQLDPDFEKTCSDIAESRKTRGESKNICAPKFFPVAPVKKLSQDATDASTAGDSNQHVSGSQAATRMSRRVRGLNADIPVEIMSIERLSRAAKPAPSGDQSSAVKPTRPRMHYGSRRRRRNRRRKPPAAFRQDTPMKLDVDAEYHAPECVEDNEEPVDTGLIRDGKEPTGYEMDEEKPRLVDAEEHMSTSEVAVGAAENGVIKNEEKSSERNIQESHHELASAKENIKSPIGMNEEKASKSNEKEHNPIIENGLDNDISTETELVEEGDKIVNSVCDINGVLNDDISASIIEKTANNEHDKWSISVQESSDNNEQTQDPHSPQKSKKVLFFDQDEIMDVTHNVQDKEESADLEALAEERHKFEQLLSQLVKATENRNIETLELYYNRIKHCIIKHKKDETKEPLLNELTSLVDGISASEH